MKTHLKEWIAAWEHEAVLLESAAGTEMDLAYHIARARAMQLRRCIVDMQRCASVLCSFEIRGIVIDLRREWRVRSITSWRPSWLWSVQFGPISIARRRPARKAGV